MSEEKSVVNKDYRTVTSTPDALVEVGKVNPDKVVSAFKVTAGHAAGTKVPHYFQMDKTPVDPKLKRYKETRIGGTIFRGSGTLAIKHGDNTKGSNSKSTTAGEPGVYIDATNGDLVLKSNRRIRIEAENIDIIATGDGGEDGVVSITANEKFLVNTKIADIEASSSGKFFSDGTVEVISKGILNIYGNLIECADGYTKTKGSVGKTNAEFPPLYKCSAWRSINSCV